MPMDWLKDMLTISTIDNLGGILYTDVVGDKEENYVLKIGPLNQTRR